MNAARSMAAEAALRAANGLILPLLRAAKRLAPLYESYTRSPLRPSTLYVSGDKRIHILTVTAPHGVMVFAVYSSAQQSRPVSPAQLIRRLARLAKKTRQLLGRIQADIVYIYLTPSRLTRTAYRIARSQGVFVALGPDAARLIVSRFLRERVRKLLSRTGRKIWGKVALLAATLHIIASSLHREEHDTELLAELIERISSKTRRHYT